MQNRPFSFSPKVCFVAGFAIPLLFGGSITPPPEETQTVAAALSSSVLASLFAVVIFFLVFQRRREALFPTFCAFAGNIIGLSGLTLFQGYDIVFVLVRMIFMLAVIGVTYQYFVKKIKK